MTHLSHVFTRKPLYAALALATLSFGGLGVPAAAFAQASTPADTPAASPAPAPQTSDSSGRRDPSIPRPSARRWRRVDFNKPVG